MPDFTQDRFLKKRHIKHRYAISDPTVFRWIRAGKLPKPEYINNQMVWRQSVIEAAEKKMLASDGSAVDHWPHSSREVHHA